MIIKQHESSQIFIRQHEDSLLLSGCAAYRRHTVIRQVGKEGRRTFRHQVGSHHDTLPGSGAGRSGTARHRTHLPRNTVDERRLQDKVRVYVRTLQDNLRTATVTLCRIHSAEVGRTAAQSAQHTAPTAHRLFCADRLG